MFTVCSLPVGQKSFISELLEKHVLMPDLAYVPVEESAKARPHTHTDTHKFTRVHTKTHRKIVQ